MIEIFIEFFFNKMQIFLIKKIHKLDNRLLMIDKHRTMDNFMNFYFSSIYPIFEFVFVFALVFVDLYL